MNDMTIYDVIEKKKELEDNIEDMIEEFSRLTGVNVDSVEIKRYGDAKDVGYPLYDVIIEVKI